MKHKDPEISDSPPWGADDWPQMTQHGLDEGDIELIRSMLEMTPRQRLESLTRFSSSIAELKRGRRIRTD